MSEIDNLLNARSNLRKLADAIIKDSNHPRHAEEQLHALLEIIFHHGVYFGGVALRDKLAKET